ncbi:hypothetical protein [Roseateles chitosanitabidus]|uniref:hypothetical protein n=1 Tax=Roseateles chitosanitabidus TaxID=65048 RepID=UPI00082A799A|nr:hypothetical protein [Roseateles chitosanitabidus]
MATWSFFFPDLLPHATGVAEPVAERALRLSAQTFFQKTRAWRVWLPEVVTVAGQRSYALPLPAGAIVERLEKATMNGRAIDVQSFSCFEADPVLHPDQCSGGVASPDRVNILLASDYGAGSKVQVLASLAPGEGATGISDDMATQFRDAIVAGAKRRLLLNPKATYFNPDLAGVAAGEFQDAIDTTKVEVHRGFTNTTPRSRPTWC